MSDKKSFPEHVAIILDGNGRWAKERGRERTYGHQVGAANVKTIVRAAGHMGVKVLTLYAFSTENWKRSAEEVGGIFGLLVKYVASELAELNENNVKVSVLGDWRAVPGAAADSIENALKTTANNDGLRFNIALNYGSRQEITRAVRKISSLVSEGCMMPDEISEETISRFLYTGEVNEYIPDPDLIIRTSGEERISNFLLWQCAYSELAFTDSLWPDFTPDEFESIVEEYTGRSRRFGGR